ncbi:MAG: mannose-1-phosphate guanylyltransferase/mannose-6-phosphate isomerase [Candidatus Omnitrophica bacterium]|jgi:mannose-1-phosphate guanylyltransferase/mannose-6-phosphate isomerase|nr:mannose-1-phosphate guanylyltransferase/mannose-6-phosphate isomerase [Candidatus Omnitrophota bacterium]
MNYGVILAGGVGSRFWPFSRELEPKQFLQVAGKGSLLQSTIIRMKEVMPAQNIYIITNQAYLTELLKQVKHFSLPEKNIILEPEGKNTAPAIALCARLIQQRDKDAVLIVLPSDHYIKDIKKFCFALQQAVICAKKGFLVTLGITPKNPSTGYGYIKVSLQPSAFSRQLNSYKVEKFLEKPSLIKAKKYFKDKRFFWNSGMFIWKASVFMDEVKLYLPQLYRQIMLIKDTGDIIKVWHKISPMSVDYGIMEHSGKIVLVPAGFDWTDLGSWDALNEVLTKDAKGNIVQADSIDLDSRGICIFSRGNRLISTIGLKDLIIADTPDALLICDRSRAQEVKKVVDQLKLSKRKEHFVHLTEKRQWGHYTVLKQAGGFKIKIIEIEPKKSLSLQRHKKRAEHWVVVSGTARVTSPSGVRLVESNQSVYIPRNAKHRLENPKNSPLKIVEVQTGSYLEEDDIERFKG